MFRKFLHKSMTGSDDDNSNNMNRRPSELNAATDLVGLSVPTPTGNNSIMIKVEEKEIERKPSNNGINSKIIIDRDDAKKSELVKNDPKQQSTAAQAQPKAATQAQESKNDDMMMDTTTATATTSEPRTQQSGNDGAPPPLQQQQQQNAAPSLPSDNNTRTAAVVGDTRPASSDMEANQPANDNDNENEKAPVKQEGLSTEVNPEDPDGEKTAFPILLHEIVTEQGTDDCIHWLSCGTRFMISDKKKFARVVLPRFYGHAKFTSFTRRLKRWSFTRVPSGPFMGAYYNANFRRGEPELAARVRYDHPAPLSGAAMQLNKAKLQAVGAGGLNALGGGLGMMGGAFGNPLLAAQVGQGQHLSNEDREAFMRQMSMMNGGAGVGAGGVPNAMAMMQGGMPQAVGGNPQLESLYMAMNQNAAAQGGNFAATNNSVALQMAMAQEMMQQRQMGALLAQQQQAIAQQQQQQRQQGNPNQMATLLNASGMNPGNAAGGQGQAGQSPEEQRMIAAMFLDRLNKQQQQGQGQGGGNNGQGQGGHGSNPNLQQQQQNQQVQQQQNQQAQAGATNAQGLGNMNFPGSSMPSLASLTASSSMASSHPSGGFVGFNFPGQAGANNQGSGNNLVNNNGQPGQSPNTSGGSLSNQLQMQQQQSSNASLTTLTGGKAQQGQINNSMGAPQLNFPNVNFPNNNNNTNNNNVGNNNIMGAGAPGTAAGALGGIAAGQTNPTAMNALLADYLRRTSGANNGPPGNNNGGDVKKEDGGSNTQVDL